MCGELLSGEQGSEFPVLCSGSLLSDHTPVSATVSLLGVDTEDLLARDHHLGEHAVSCEASLRNKNCVNSYKRY